MNSGDQEPTEAEFVPLEVMTQESRLPLSSAAMLYGGMAVVAWLGAWWLLDGPYPAPLVLSSVVDAPPLWVCAALGVAGGLVTVVLDRVLERVVPALKQMSRAFYEVLGVMSHRQAVALAVLSSVGEELLFRGLLLPWLGLTVSSLLFGAMHVPVDRRLWPWPIFAALMGFVFGMMAEYTGNLLAPVLAHFVINYLGFLRIRSMGSRLAVTDR